MFRIVTVVGLHVLEINQFANGTNKDVQQRRLDIIG